MIVIQPVAVTPAALVSSSLPEADAPAWAPATTYAEGATVLRNHRLWQSAAGGNLGNDPATADETAWADAGPTNRWAMFDQAGGPVSTAAGVIEVVIAPGAPIGGVGLVDVMAATVRVRVSGGGVSAYDRTQDASGRAVAFLDLPVSIVAPTITITVTPAAGASAGIGRLVIGSPLFLGATESGPTIAITDFSKRTTDDFGVTTVVPRGWAKQITVRSRIDSAALDNTQRRLAALRATPALWLGDATFPALTTFGFFKDLSVDLQLGAITFVSLTITGLPNADLAVPVIDPAPTGASSFQVVRPATVTDAGLTASSVPENDHPAWSAVAAYPRGVRVISTGAHRVYESLIDANLGHDPTAQTGEWLDTGPTNRWAMFDQALGTVTSGAGQVAVTLTAPSAVAALAVLDVIGGATVRLQAPGYDQTRLINPAGQPGASFLDLAAAAGAAITVTIAAAAGDAVSVGTLLFGSLEPLGVTATSPTVTITDFSKVATDDFGVTTAVERAWAKKLTATVQVASSAVEGLVRRVASLRAQPSLWVADSGFDALSIYGFFRDFSLTLADGVSTFGITVEGLTTAAPAADPIGDLGEAAAKATAAAGAAAKSAGQALDELDLVKSDAWLSAGEKPEIVRQWTMIAQEKPDNDARADAFGVARDGYDAAYTALAAMLMGLTPVWNDTSTNTPINPAVFSPRFTALYLQRQLLLNAIAAKAATLATWDGVTGAGKPSDYATTTFNQAAPPTAAESREDDAWQDTGDGNMPYRRLFGSGRLAFVGSALLVGGVGIVLRPWALARDDGKTSTFRQDGLPIATAIGDTWYQPSTGQERRWNGAIWEITTDTTALAQVTVDLTAAAVVGCDPIGAPLALELPRRVGLKVARGADSITGDDTVSYAATFTNLTGTMGDGTGGTVKGTAIVTAMSANEGYLDVIVTVGGVAQQSKRCVFSKQLAQAAQTGGTGAKRATDTTLDSISSTVAVQVSDTLTVTLAASEKLYGSGAPDYYVNGERTVRTASVYWAYRVAGSGGAFTAFGAAITGSVAHAGYTTGETTTGGGSSFQQSPRAPGEYIDPTPGNVDTSQSIGGLTSGDYEVALFASASANGATITWDTNGGFVLVEAKA